MIRTTWRVFAVRVMSRLSSGYEREYLIETDGDHQVAMIRAISAAIDDGIDDPRILGWENLRGQNVD